MTHPNKSRSGAAIEAELPLRELLKGAHLAVQSRLKERQRSRKQRVFGTESQFPAARAAGSKWQRLSDQLAQVLWPSPEELSSDGQSADERIARMRTLLCEAHPAIERRCRVYWKKVVQAQRGQHLRLAEELKAKARATAELLNQVEAYLGRSVEAQVLMRSAA
jgi:hypothetical protein